MQRLYLSDNQITGQLPQQWSDDSALYELGRLDLYGNNLTGPVSWKVADLPHLENLVLLPGACLQVQALTYMAESDSLVRLSGLAVGTCQSVHVMPPDTIADLL